ncbi:MAG: hypothetical protein IIC75_02165 [Bacteroidetes bacterium]|nr:hypothetical protein [Bacteroidota bacterium]
MHTKKFWITLVVVFVVMEVLNFLIHGVMLAETYASEPLKSVFRSKEEMEGMMWIMWLMDIVYAYFFCFFFAKGYENKGIGEGLRFGLYIGLFFSLTFAFSSYAIYPLTYGIVLQWFLYGLVVSLIMGVVASLLYKPTAEASE